MVPCPQTNCIPCGVWKEVHHFIHASLCLHVHFLPVEYDGNFSYEILDWYWVELLWWNRQILMFYIDIHLADFLIFHLFIYIEILISRILAFADLRICCTILCSLFWISIYILTNDDTKYAHFLDNNGLYIFDYASGRTLRFPTSFTTHAWNACSAHSPPFDGSYPSTLEFQNIFYSMSPVFTVSRK